MATRTGSKAASKKTDEKDSSTTTAATKKAAAKKGTFESLIKRSGDSIIGDRGDRIVKSAKVAQRGLVDKISQDLMLLEDKRDLMLDQSPDNRYSLTVGKSFEADKWTQEYHAISVSITNKKVELEIAQANFKELFGEVID